MTTGQTVLLVGGVALGAFVLVRLTAGPAPKPAASGTSTLITQGIIGLGSALGSYFKSGGSSSSDVGIGSDSAAVYKPGESFGDYSSGLFGPGINPDGTGD